MFYSLIITLHLVYTDYSSENAFMAVCIVLMILYEIQNLKSLSIPALNYICIKSTTSFVAKESTPFI